VLSSVALVGGLGLATGTMAGAKSTSAKVAKFSMRKGVGDILVAAKKGATLYVDTAGPCTGSCLTVWPPLLLPSGKTVPTGAAGLGTTPFGTSGQLQVTDHSMPLYTFENDSGHSVNGNGVAGFMVVPSS
jgi:predicted lipoprotein with Yx(FWY)xxD motif